MIVMVSTTQTRRTFIVFTFCFVQICSDDVLKLLRFSRNVRNNWFQYVTKFAEKLFSSTRRRQESSEYVTSSMGRLFSRHLLNISKLSCFRPIGRGYANIAVTVTEHNFLPFLKEKYPDKNHITNSVFYAPVFTKRIWTFQLHSSLRLNVTFHKIYFSFNHRQCNYGKVKILSYLKKTAGTVQYVLCGQYPLVNFYSPFHLVEVLHLPKLEFSQLNISFQVLNSQILMSIPRQKTPDRIIFTYDFLLDRKQLSFYLVQVVHHHVIAAKVIFYSHDPKQYTIYDGPSIWSPYQHITTSQRYHSSSFQCLLTVLNSYNFITNNGRHSSLDFVATRTMQEKHATLLSRKELTLEHKNSNMSRSYSIHTVRNSCNCSQNMNFSLVYFKYTGDHSDCCMFGGLIFYQWKLGVFCKILLTV